MHQVHVATAAEHDLLRITDFVAFSSLSMAEHVQEHLTNAIDSLEYFPNRGAIAPESESWGLIVRVLVVFNYRILYTVRQSDVVMLRIVHGSQRTPVRPGP